MLVVCPASLKSQWRNEIHRFCDRDVQLIAGRAAERAAQYANDCFFTVCNYEQVLRDILAIEQTPWDLIILDEGQRIKNWEAKTSRVIKGLQVAVRPGALRHAAGEPARRAVLASCSSSTTAGSGPGFRFFNQHRVVDEKGKVLGYKNLDELRERCGPILLRRTRDSVKLELPPRTDRDRPHPADRRAARRCTTATCRSSATIVAQEVPQRDGPAAAAEGAADVPHGRRQHVPGRQAEARLFHASSSGWTSCSTSCSTRTDRKVVLFSEWTTMLDLIEPLLTKRKLRLRAPRRQRAAEAAAGAGARVPDRSRRAGCSSPPTPARRA